MSGISYFKWLSYMAVSLIPYSIVAVIGIILSITHIGKKGNFAVFSLIAYTLSLLNTWVLNYFLYSAGSSTVSIITGVLAIVSSVFLLLAIFSGRAKKPDQDQRYAPYLYPTPQPPYTTAGQVQGYPPQPPQPPQNPPTSNP